MQNSMLFVAPKELGFIGGTCVSVESSRILNRFEYGVKC